MCEHNSGAGLLSSRYDTIMGWELGCGADTASLGARDYSFKPVKAIVADEAEDYFTLSKLTTIPLFYGAQPNLGIYYQPDGPYPNPSELLPQGKIAEARKAQEDAAEQMKEDIVYVGSFLYDIGCEGLNLDTAASAGDAEFLGSLEAVAVLKQKCPNMAIEVGMSSEFVLGMHGELTYKNERLAGMFPHDQVRMAEAAGVDVFGPVVNTNTSKSIPWNLSFAVTLIKEASAVAHIPLHANAGMGVCGVPMILVTPIDTVTRVSKSLVQIGKIDGL
jgi:dimethylamine--corrinoid protein Co-methyltransferase